jgi:TolB protein
VSAAPYRVLASGQRTEVWIHDMSTGANERVHVTRDRLLEAPNWHPDGTALILNGDGVLWRLDIADSALTPIEIADAPTLNNDHVLGPDGIHIFLSGDDGHLYRAPLAGGRATRITRDGAEGGIRHYLHGVAPDGARLAFIGLRVTDAGDIAAAEVYTVGVDGDDYQQLTNTGAPADGSEYHPSGEWIYLNTEQFTGAAQLARMRVDGAPIERVGASDTVDWFPHVSPNGAWLCHLAYPSGTQGHPADRWVELRLAPTERPDVARTVARLFGGQGTINVNSWSPDSTRFAYVGYPVDEHSAP